MSVERLENTLKVSTYTPDGALVETRELHNVPMVELFPEEPVAIIRWLYGRETLPTEEEISKPVTIDGKEFFGHWGWGSGIKPPHGDACAFIRDILRDSGIMRDATRAIMTSRYLLNQGVNGGVKGEFTVQVVKRGAIVNGHKVDDGFGLARRSTVEKGYQGKKITLGKARQSYSYWQRIPWSLDLMYELEPLFDAKMKVVGDTRKWKLTGVYGPSWDEKERLLEADGGMIRHPYVAPQFLQVWQDFVSRAATTADIPTWVKIAVPTSLPHAAVQGRHSLTRFPIASNGNIQAVDIEESDEVRAEMQRIAKLEVIQHTISSMQLMAKGCFGVIDDAEMPEGIDFVICEDDIKMRVPEMDGLKAGDTIVLEAVVPFHQWFAAGSAIGMNVDWASPLMALDCDGDLVFDSPLDDFPVLYFSIKKMKPGNTDKLPKVPQPLEMRPRMAVYSMANLVGMATRVAACTFAVQNRDLLARQLGFRNEEAMDTQLTFWISAGTDGTKKAIDLPAIQREVEVFQGNLMSFVGKGAMWARWPDGKAFAREVPYFEEPGMSRSEKKRAIPIHFNGTVAMFLKRTLPDIATAMEDLGIGTPMDTIPLGHYKGWCAPVSELLGDAAHQLQLEFNEKVHAVNFFWTEDSARFREQWKERVHAWADEMGISYATAAAALWTEAHGSRSENAGAASVFMGFPDECVEIVRDKPGVGAKFDTLVIGLGYVFDEPPEHLIAEVEIREYRQQKAGKTLIRSILVGKAPGQKKARAPYPADMLGIVEITSAAPEPGVYQAELIKSGKGQAWHCKLR